MREFQVLLPSRYDADVPMSRATFNRVTYSVVEKAKEEGLPLEPFTVHDLRRTGSTLLSELGFNSDWIGKCLAHEDGRSSRGVYNKAEYEHQRRHMLRQQRSVGHLPRRRPDRQIKSILLQVRTLSYCAASCGSENMSAADCCPGFAKQNSSIANCETW